MWGRSQKSERPHTTFNSLNQSIKTADTARPGWDTAEPAGLEACPDTALGAARSTPDIAYSAVGEERTGPAAGERSRAELDIDQVPWKDPQREPDTALAEPAGVASDPAGDIVQVEAARGSTAVVPGTAQDTAVCSDQRGRGKYRERP